MKLSETIVRRPVLVSVVSVFLLLAGGMALPNLPVREYPSIDPASVSVSASWRGADAETMEKQVAEPLEQSLNGIDGIRTMTSTSRDERTRISIEFLMGIDIERAANDVRDRVARAQRRLPADVEPPSVSKADANSSPVFMLALRGVGRDLMEMTDIATMVQERLQTVPGLAEVGIWGERKRSMRLRIDPAKLAASGVTLQDIRSALARENVDLPAGQIEGRNVSVALKARTGLATPEDFGAVVLRRSGQGVVRLRDLARVEEAAENEKTLTRLNGEPGMALAFVPQPGSNQIAIVDEVRARLPRIRSDLPEGVELLEVFDNTVFVRKALSEVGETIAIAFGLVVLVIFGFLRDWRTTLVPVLSIPVSLVGVFAMVWALGYSINVLTLLGVVLSIGIVVDDAIVVLENIYARMEEGLSAHEAAVKGLEEIFAAVVATTLVLCAVFVPLLFLQGFTGRLFREFGVVIGGSVLISGFVALTLAAMLSKHALHGRTDHGRLYKVTEPFFAGMAALYERFLRASLCRAWVAIVILAACGGLIAWLLGTVPRELAPAEDRGTMQINMSAHEGATYSFLDEWMAKANDSLLAGFPEIRGLLASTASSYGSSNGGSFRVVLSPREERERGQDSIAAAMQKLLPRLGSGTRTSVVQEQAIRVGGRQSLPVQLVVQGPDLAALREVLPELEAVARKDPSLAMVETDLRFTKPRLDLDVRRDALVDLGISPDAVATSLQLAYGMPTVGTYLRAGKQYSVLAELERAGSPGSFDWVPVPSSHGGTVPLGALVKAQETMVPPQRIRTDRLPSFTLSAAPAAGVPLGEAVEVVGRIADSVLDERFQTRWSGSARDYLESSSSLGAVFALAIVVVFLLLAAQFESLRAPFVILLTVPLALVGALGALKILGMTLNLFSEIGLVMLVGLVTKNGILIVEFAQQRRDQGLDAFESVVGAATARLRPILMTTVATILGIMPVALALGAGAESRIPLGVAVIGGMSSSLVLTLFVVPAMYLLIAPKARTTGFEAAT